MAHWAEVDADNIVLRVLVTSNDDEDEGHGWLVSNLGGRWLKTSYNTVGGQHVGGGTPYRGNYAGIGYEYRADLDAFIPPNPGDGWVLDEATFTWVPVEG
jgi:hypothetical protein